MHRKGTGSVVQMYTSLFIHYLHFTTCQTVVGQKLAVHELHYEEQQLLQVWGLEASVLTNCCNQDPVQPARPLSPLTPFFYIIYLSPSLVVLFVLLYLSISLFSVPVCLFFSQPIHIILPLLPPPTNTHRYEHTDFIRLRWVGLLQAYIGFHVYSMCTGAGAPPGLKPCYSDK